MTSAGHGKWLIYKELGALCGHKDPEAFADFIASGPCEHLGKREFDKEKCPAPCGLTHVWCLDCGRPLEPHCTILDTEVPPLPGGLPNRKGARHD